MWDERFAGENFFYGMQPNDFLREQVHKLHGKILSLAEGEGRNAVFMAQQGLNVLGVDGSVVGLAKAQQLAKQQGVTIDTLVVDLADYTPAANGFDGAVSIFAHLPPALRQAVHHKVEAALKPGGIFILEGYSKAQIHNDTGGPKNIDMLYDQAELIQELPSCELLLAQTIEREVLEGQGHTGLASVVQIVARKRSQ